MADGRGFAASGATCAQVAIVTSGITFWRGTALGKHFSRENFWTIELYRCHLLFPLFGHCMFFDRIQLLAGDSSLDPKNLSFSLLPVSETASFQLSGGLICVSALLVLFSSSICWQSAYVFSVSLSFLFTQFLIYWRGFLLPCSGGFLHFFKLSGLIVRGHLFLFVGLSIYVFCNL